MAPRSLACRGQFELDYVLTAKFNFVKCIRNFRPWMLIAAKFVLSANWNELSAGNVCRRCKQSICDKSASVVAESLREKHFRRPIRNGWRLINHPIATIPLCRRKTCELQRLHKICVCVHLFTSLERKHFFAGQQRRLFMWHGRGGCGTSRH